jgi:hypothetical protein
MKILINDKQNLLDQRGIENTQSKVAAAFAKFGAQLKTVEVTVQDINGPRGGIDQECRVSVKLKKLNDLSVAVKDETLSKAIANCIGRASRSVSRQLERKSFRERGRMTGLDFAFRNGA